MKRLAIGITILLGYGCSALASLVQTQPQPSGQGATLAVVGAKIYPAPTAQPITNGVVLIQRGKIIAVGEQQKIRIPKNSQRLDGQGLTLLAGFWNSHVHFIEPHWRNAAHAPAEQLAQRLQEMLTRYGFVHVLDTGSLELPNLSALRRRIESGEIAGPAIRLAGVPFAPPKGSPSYILPLKVPEIGTPEEATRHVQNQIAAGADAIKLWSAAPVLGRVVPMPLDVAQAAAAAAHALRKPVIAHPTTNVGVDIVIRGGIDILAHTTPDGLQPWNDETVSRMRAAGVALIPTLKLWQWETQRKGVAAALSAKFSDIAQQQLRAYAQAGGMILFGTDVGYMTDYDPTEEYARMAQAGMTARQIIAALTTAPAAKFGVARHTGRIVAGCDADLVLLAGDPAADVKALAQVRYTLRKGKIIYDAKAQ